MNWITGWNKTKWYVLLPNNLLHKWLKCIKNIFQGKIVLSISNTVTEALQRKYCTFVAYVPEFGVTFLEFMGLKRKSPIPHRSTECRLTDLD